MKIRELTAADYPSVKAIYLEGIATKQATFQTEAPEWEAWDSSHLTHSRFVAIDGNEVAGWAVLSAVSNRCVYAGVAEISIYIAAGHRGKGVGHALMQAVIQSSETQNIWTLQAGIFPENAASMNLHFKNGFRLIGIREKVGKMENVWRDTAILERRSKIVGID
jgi:L-amino acid N-acyltransferase YncA